MLKRVVFLAIFLLALVVPTASFAQDNSPGPVWDLTQSFTITDLGITLKFPTDWVSDTSNGITLGESKSDIQAYLSSDSKTQPKGAIINITAIPMSNLTSQLGDNPTLEQIGDLMVKIGDIKETESRVEIPVMARRTLSVIGTSNKNGRGGIATIWRQGDYVVVASASAPDMTEMIKDSYSWGQVLGSMTPSDALPLNETALRITDGGFQLNVPQKWYQSSDGGNLFYELKDDMKNKTFTGDFIFVKAQTLKDAGLTTKSTLDDLVKKNIDANALQEPIRREEFILLGQPAITLRAEDSSGLWGLVTQTIVNGNAITLAVAAPSEDKLNQIEPTWIAVLKSVQTIVPQ